MHTKAVVTGVCVGVTTMTTLRWTQIANTQALKSALAVEIRDQFLPLVKSPCAANMKFIAIVISVVGDPNDSPHNISTNVVGSGTLGPQQVALQINFLTGTAGRRGRGKIYVPGIFTTAISEGNFSTSQQTVLNSSMVTLKNRYAVGGSTAWTLGVYSRADDVIRPVVDFTYNLVPSTLRSRKLGVGV
jgi:hypothetical protein